MLNHQSLEEEIWAPERPSACKGDILCKSSFSVLQYGYLHNVWAFWMSSLPVRVIFKNEIMCLVSCWSQETLLKILNFQWHVTSQSGAIVVPISSGTTTATSPRILLFLALASPALDCPYIKPSSSPAAGRRWAVEQLTWCV